MSLNLTVDGDNCCAFGGATAGSGVPLGGGVLGCGGSSGSSGNGSPNGWNGKVVPPSSQGISSLPTSAASVSSVSVATSGQPSVTSLGSWNLNSPTPSNNSHFANASMQSQQQQQQPQQQPQQPSQQQQHSPPSPQSQQQPLQTQHTQALPHHQQCLQPHSQSQQANPSNGTGAMTTAALISGEIIVDSQDNETWPSITSMTSTTTSTTGSNSNGNANKAVSSVSTSATSAVSAGQVTGTTPGVLMIPSAPTDQDSALVQSDVWGTSSGSSVPSGSSWGGPFAQPPTGTSSSLASLWGGSSNVGLNSDPNYSPWGNTNTVMPHNTGSLWNSAASSANPQDQGSGEWSAQSQSQQKSGKGDTQQPQSQPPSQQQPQPQQMQPQQRQQPQQQNLMQIQQQQQQEMHLQQQQLKGQSNQGHPQQLHQLQLQAPVPQPGGQQQPQTATHGLPQQQQQRQPDQRHPQQQQQQRQQLPQQQQQQMQHSHVHQQSGQPQPQTQQQPSQSPQVPAQSPTWGTSSSGPGSSGWLHSAVPSSRATPTNEVAAITSQEQVDASGQTWAQAAGKGVSEAPTPVPGSCSGVKSPEDLLKDENERQVWALVNSNDGWGKRPVNQGTPWDCGLVKDDQMKHVDSNVWMNEPPNGTGQWEHHYESLGEKTARWSVLNKPVSSGGAGGATNQWGRSTSMSGAEGVTGSEGPFWNGQTQSWERGQRNAPARLHSVSGVPTGSTGTWGAEEWGSTASHRSSVSDATDWSRGGEPWIGASGATTPTNSSGPTGRWGQQGQDDNSNMWTNSQSQSGSMNRGSVHSDDFNRRMPMSNNAGGNRTGMRAQIIRKFTDMGFRREDAQQALISHNMNFERALQELQNKRSMVLSASCDYSSHSNSNMLSRNQSSVMNLPLQSQANQHQQTQGHQQQQQPQQQQAPHPQQQQQHHQQQHQHQQQQLMRQQIMNQLQASVQTRMQAGNGSGSGQQVSQGSGNQSSGVQNNTLYQLQQQHQQVRQQINLMQHRAKNLHSQMLQMTTTGNMNAARTLQQQLDMLNSELNTYQKHLQSITMRLAQFQNSAHSHPQQHQQPSPSQHQHPQASQHHMTSNMMNPQMNHDRQYNSQLNDMMERMSGLMPNTNGMTGNHAGMGGWKSNDQGAAGWYNIPGVTDDQQRSHGPGQHNLSSSAQISNLSMDIPEFIPGKPWQGITPKDDPNMTVGSRKGVFNMLNNDHLEKLSTKDSNVRSPQSPGGPYASNHRRHHGGYNGTSMYHQFGSACILIRNMPSNVTVDLIKLMVAQQGPVIAIQPNLNAGWVLVRFANPEDAVKAQKNLTSAHFGQVESITEQEAQRLQQEIQALAARFNPNTAWSNNFAPSGDALPPEAHLIPGDI